MRQSRRWPFLSDRLSRLLRHERETPVYRPQGDNDIIWCFGLSTMSYHCSTAALVGLAE